MKTKAFAIVSLLAACGLILFTAGHTPKKQSNMITITKNNIISPFGVQPDVSVDLKKVAAHYKKFPARWEAAFRFLSGHNLLELPVGRTDLSDDVYVTVSEYTTKKQEDAAFESHKKYIDLQYIISGVENIGLTHDTSIPVKIPYNEDKDIAFYNFNGGILLQATPAVFFIFFPDDLHRPCIKAGEPALVKKIVIKIKV
jgi:YhcH/YjgK/YiaL family protein